MSWIVLHIIVAVLTCSYGHQIPPPFLRKFTFAGRFLGRCGHVDGYYYKDRTSFVQCDNGRAILQYCASGTANSHEDTFAIGSYEPVFCDINLLSHGYSQHPNTLSPKLNYGPSSGRAVPKSYYKLGAPTEDHHDGDIVHKQLPNLQAFKQIQRHPPPSNRVSVSGVASYADGPFHRGARYHGQYPIFPLPPPPMLPLPTLAGYMYDKSLRPPLPPPPPPRSSPIRAPWGAPPVSLYNDPYIRMHRDGARHGHSHDPRGEGPQVEDEAGDDGGGDGGGGDDDGDVYHHHGHSHENYDGHTHKYEFVGNHRQERD